jgi:hypothetical protein
VIVLPASCGAAEQVAGRRLNVTRMTVQCFLAPSAKWSPRHRGNPLRVDIFTALLAGPEVAFFDPA